MWCRLLPSPGPSHNEQRQRRPGQPCDSRDHRGGDASMRPTPATAPDMLTQIPPGGDSLTLSGLATARTWESTSEQEIKSELRELTERVRMLRHELEAMTERGRNRSEPRTGTGMLRRRPLRERERSR